VAAMTTPNLDTVEIKAFVPAKDFELSKRFYQALGFTMPFSDDDLAYLHCGECSFLLQNFHVPEHTANFQMHLLVQDVDAWHAHVTNQRLVERFGVRIGTPENQPWAMRDFVLFDPSGVLWRIAQNITRQGEGGSESGTEPSAGA
jgi:catechol 2,3-dioxygenase-like lactoylglutathione lyase family enzyme